MSAPVIGEPESTSIPSEPLTPTLVTVPSPTPPFKISSSKSALANVTKSATFCMVSSDKMLLATKASSASISASFTSSLASAASMSDVCVALTASTASIKAFNATPCCADKGTVEPPVVRSSTIPAIKASYSPLSANNLASISRDIIVALSSAFS